MQVTMEIGQKYGHLTAIKPAPRGNNREARFICQCDCGFIGSFNVYQVKRGKTRYCRRCAPHSGGHPKPDIVGKNINGWLVLEDIGYEKRPDGSARKYRCKCTRCGHETIKTHGNMKLSKSGRCSFCPPMYDFQIEGLKATGALSNGEHFIIDTTDIPLVSRYSWSIGYDGYVVTHKPKMSLHRLIAGVYDPKVMVDHINRNRKDCRRENLRVISTFGNSCNHSLFQTNKTGYTGVYFSKHSGGYEVKVGYNHRRILLGSTKDEKQLIMLAQMYNIAAAFFFGDYVGELNDVPDPPEDLVDRIIAKCKKYLRAPAEAGAFVA